MPTESLIKFLQTNHFVVCWLRRNLKVGLHSNFVVTHPRFCVTQKNKTRSAGADRVDSLLAGNTGMVKQR